MSVATLIREALALDPPPTEPTPKTRVAQIAVGDLAALAQQALAGLTDDTTLTTIIRTAYGDAYTWSLAQEVARAGGDRATVALVDQAILASLDSEAAKWSTKIVQTFEGDLLRFLDGLPADTQRADVPQLIADWNLQRSMWKDAQIAITETQRAIGKAQRDFIDKSGATGKAWFGNSLICHICQNVAANNPYDLDDSLVGSSFHPHELDSWRIVYDSVPNMWTGGTTADEEDI